MVPAFNASWLLLADPWLGWALLLGGMAWYARRAERMALGIVLTGLAVLCLSDLTRLQAWTWQYGCMVLLVMLSGKDEPKLPWLRLLLGFTYCWSGIHKLNVHFQHNVFEWMAGIYEWTLPLTSSKIAGYSVGVMETLLGVLFLWRKTSAKIAPVLGILFHIGILSLLIKSDWNHVVWPWNLCMMALCVLLFRYADTAELPSLWYKKTSYLVVTLLFGILPAGLLVDAWPAHLSLSMYSGRTIEGAFIVARGHEGCLPPSALPYWETLVEDDSTLLQLPLDNWSTPVLGTPAYPGEASYKQMARKLCDCVPASVVAGLKVTTYPVLQESKTEYYDCKELRR